MINNSISISSIIIIYEILVFLLLILKIININNAKNVLSPLVIINFFIILIMYTTRCKIDTKTKICVVSIKLILLFLVLLISNFTFINYLYGILILIVYLFISNINKIYDCNIKLSTLLYTLVISSIIYFGLLF